MQAYACRPELPIFSWENKVLQACYAWHPELPTFFGENKAQAYYAWRPELPIPLGRIRYELMLDILNFRYLLGD